MIRQQNLANLERPKKWEEVISQDPIVITLRNILSKKYKALPNGFIFSGTRGVGKTTCARIFARSLVCKSSKKGNPCNKCSSCKMSLSLNHPDIKEIDAVNKGKVDDVRALCENASHYPISDSEYKVFILDEAHNLATSMNAFDALLKELEEPKEHVFWILCTTQKNKIPLPIRSRLLSFDFKLVPSKDLSTYLSKLSYFSKLQVEPEVFDLIALRANNSIRDALTLVDTFSPYLNEQGWALENLKKILGSFDVDIQIQMMIKILDQDVIGLWRILENALESGAEPTEVFNSLINLINFLMSMATGCGDLWVEYKDNSNIGIVFNKLQSLGLDKLIKISDVIIRRKSDLDSFDNKKFILQTTAIELCS